MGFSTSAMEKLHAMADAAVSVDGHQLRRIDLRQTPVSAEIYVHGKWVPCHVHIRCTIAADELVIAHVRLDDVRRAITQLEFLF